MLSSIEKLQKFFRLEIERGYDNRAVVGGLDKILPAWESEARANRLNEETIQTVIEGLRAYPSLEPPERAEMLSRLAQQLTQSPSGAAVSPQTARAYPTPEGAAPRAEAASADEPRAPANQEPAEPEPEPENTKTDEPRLAQPERAEQTAAAKQPAAAAHQPAAPAPARRPVHEVAGRSHEPPGGLKAPVSVLQGVGSKLSQTLNDVGLYTLEDMLYYFPRRYDDYSQLKPINRLAFGEETTVLGTVQSAHTRPIRGGKMQMTEVIVTDGTGSLRVTWFNQPWLANKLAKGMQVVLAGKVDQYLGRPTMTNPEMEPLETEHLHTNRIVPVYPLTAGLTQKNLRKLMYQTVSYWAPRIRDYLPDKVRAAVKMVDLGSALINTHFPDSQDMLDVARWRLAFDEIFLLQLGVLRQKRSWQEASAQVFVAPQEWLDTQIARLPFTLTGAQGRVIEEIRADLASGRPMERLVQGDVGSGKTAVAAIAAAVVMREGGQVAVMAPTSILAEQHYRSFKRLLAEPVEKRRSVEIAADAAGNLPEADNMLEAENLPEAEKLSVEGEEPAVENGAAVENQPAAEEPAEILPGFLQPEEIRLLVGDTPEAEKQAIRAGLEDGSIKLVIGTHALIESPVQFQRLQLAVIDEQHRFGVSQRATLREKGANPHLLVMTATPIPRSLALTVYGDLDLSVMDEMPPGRQPVDTHVLPPVERERAYNLIRAQVEKGCQAFIIYPMVEQGESEQALAVVEEHKRLQAQVFPRRRVAMMHGRMKPEEKDAIMAAFRNREYDILVSTTVVEVGVDIPNATVMLIEGANRFGLAQLHQLRGRVGRGSAKAYCLLIPDSDDAVENERLSVMASTNDGFVLAEHDLNLRGPGEFLGTRQAGFSELKMAKLTDVRLIEKARQQAVALFQEDPTLSATEYQPLAVKLEEFWGGGRGDIS